MIQIYCSAPCKHNQGSGICKHPGVIELNEKGKCIMQEEPEPEEQPATDERVFHCGGCGRPGVRGIYCPDCKGGGKS